MMEKKGVYQNRLGRQIIILLPLVILALGILLGVGAQAHAGMHIQSAQPTNGQTQSIEIEQVPAGLTVDEWSAIQQNYLKASNTEWGDSFGVAVAASGNTVVIGASGEDSSSTGVNGNQADNSANSSGAVYVFVRSGNAWSQQAYIKASNTEEDDHFGSEVAISGNTLVVGAWGEDSSATGIDGNQADNSATDSGAVYVFTRSGDTWSQQAYIKASNTDAGDEFGAAIAISDDTVVVGASDEDSNATGINGNQNDNSAYVSGAVYVFVRSGNAWSQQAYIKASDTGSWDIFGWSVSVSGNTLVVGAPYEDSGATGVDGNQNSYSELYSGAAYVFTRSNGVWSQQAYLKASNTEEDDHFGWSVSVSDDTVVVGAPGEDSYGRGVDSNQTNDWEDESGAAYIFTRNNGIWSQQAYLKSSNSDEGDNFGWSVSVFGDTVGVGAYYEDSNAIGVNGDQADNSATSAGAAYIFTRSNGIWGQQYYLKASNTEDRDFFGKSVSISSGMMVAGAFAEESHSTGVDGDQDDNSLLNAGAAYVFGFWSPKTADTVCNGGCEFRYIQDAIDNAADGDTIYLAGETFTEILTIDKSLTILGKDRESTILQADNAPGIAASGVIRITSGVTVTMEHVSIRYGNQDGDFGGGIYNNGNLTLAHSAILSNTCTISGGGIASIDGDLTLTDVVISGNQSGYMGGGVYLSGPNKSKLTAVTISQNSADDLGGGIHTGNNNYQTTIDDSTLFGNTAGYSGGGIYFTDAVTISHSIIQANSAADKGGGLATEYGTGNLRIRTSRIEDNQADTGGGMYLEFYGNQYEGEIRYSSILNNSSTGHSGGGVYFSDGNTLKINSSTVSGNSSQEDGGGVKASDYFESTNSTYSGNSAIGNGGGIALSYASANLKSVTITDNQADTDWDNSGNGGGLYRVNSAYAVTITNSIIADNLDRSTYIADPNDCYGDFTSGGFNVIGTNYECNGWVGSDIVGSWDSMIDPLLLPLADNGGPTWTHALDPSSPAIDIHHQAALCPNKDQRGVNRPQDGDGNGSNRCDAGAYELGTCNPASVPTITIGRDDNDVLLTWNDDAVNREYVVVRATDYVQLTNLFTTTVFGNNYTDYSAIGDPQDNYVYAVLAENACGERANESNMVAEYDFRLAAEDSVSAFSPTGALRRLHFSLIALPLEGANLPTTADEVANYIDPDGSVKGVAKWNALTQSWIVRRVGNPFGTPDFTVAPGDVLLLGLVESAPDNFAWIGDIPADGSIQNSLAPGVVFVMVPLDQSGEFTMTAEGLAADIGGITHVGAWSTAEQRWYLRIIGQSGLNFPIRPGKAYVIAGKTIPQVWP